MRPPFASPFRTALLLLVLVALGGCDTPPKRETFPELTYQYLPPIRLDVARIEVIEAYPVVNGDGHVESQFPTPPGTAAAHWGRDRLAAAGPDGLGRYIVLEASAVQVSLPRTTGLTGVVTVDQSDRYDAVVKVRLELANRNGMQKGAISAEAGESATVPEDMTLNQRERFWFDMTKRLMDRLNAELEKQIATHLAGFVK